MKVLSLGIWENSTLIIEIEKLETGQVAGWCDWVLPCEMMFSEVYQQELKHMGEKARKVEAENKSMEKLTLK